MDLTQDIAETYWSAATRRVSFVPTDAADRARRQFARELPEAMRRKPANMSGDEFDAIALDRATHLLSDAKFGRL